MVHGHYVTDAFPAPGRRLLRGWIRLLSGLLLVCQVSGCSLYSAGRTFFDDPLASMECWTECPWATEPVTLRHGDTGATVTCGPYPHALYTSMAATYRLERRECISRYQQQGYLPLARR